METVARITDRTLGYLGLFLIGATLAPERLTDAVLVNPYDTEGTADAIHSALVMPLDERCARHERLLAEVRRHDVHWWRKSFLDALKEATT